jgi:CrcB protein
MIKNLLIVALGGGTGSILRYVIQKIMQPHSLSAFPAATFLINIAGCFLIGLLWGLFYKSENWGDEMKLLLMPGLCGGFTTFSAFTLEGIGLLKENKIGLFLTYIAASVLLGLLATYSGMRLVK